MRYTHHPFDVVDDEDYEDKQLEQDLGDSPYDEEYRPPCIRCGKFMVYAPDMACPKCIGEMMEGGVGGYDRGNGVEGTNGGEGGVVKSGKGRGGSSEGAPGSSRGGEGGGGEGSGSVYGVSTSKDGEGGGGASKEGEGGVAWVWTSQPSTWRSLRDALWVDNLSPSIYTGARG